MHRSKTKFYLERPMGNNYILANDPFIKLSHFFFTLFIYIGMLVLIKTRWSINESSPSFMFKQRSFCMLQMGEWWFLKLLLCIVSCKHFKDVHLYETCLPTKIAIAFFILMNWVYVQMVRIVPSLNKFTWVGMDCNLNDI